MPSTAIPRVQSISLLSIGEKLRTQSPASPFPENQVPWQQITWTLSDRGRLKNPLHSFSDCRWLKRRFRRRQGTGRTAFIRLWTTSSPHYVHWRYERWAGPFTKPSQAAGMTFFTTSFRWKKCWAICASAVVVTNTKRKIVQPKPFPTFQEISSVYIVPSVQGGAT